MKKFQDRHMRIAGVLTYRPYVEATSKCSVKLGLIAISAALLVFTSVTSHDVNNSRRYVAFERSSIDAQCESPIRSRTGNETSLRVLVSFVHYETDGMSTCELANKRNNLATFLLSAVPGSPEGINFVFTFPGRKPSPSDILGTSGLSPGSESGKVITQILSKQARNVEFLDSSVNHSAADLCHHHAAIFDSMRNKQHFDFVLVLNDGVRGPFFDTDKVSDMVWIAAT